MHLQAPTDNWLETLPHLPDGALIKAFSGSMLEDARVRWQLLGREASQLHTCLRFNDLHVALGDWETLKSDWRAQFWRFIDGTHLSRYARHISFIEECNEYTDQGMADSPVLGQAQLASAQAAAWVWAHEFRGRWVTNPVDGGYGFIPADTRLVLGNVPVGNDVPKAWMQLALDNDDAVGYHPYLHMLWLPDGTNVRDPGDWQFHSGRWNFCEQRWGLKPKWVFTECGPYASVEAGWRHKDVCNSNEDLLVEVMRAWGKDVTATHAYREGRIYGPGAWFTSGHIGWDYYQLDTPQLIRLADMFRELWVPPREVDMDAQIAAQIAQHLDGMHQHEQAMRALLATLPQVLYRVRLPAIRALRDAAGNPATHPTLAPQGLVAAGTVVDVYVENLVAGGYSDRLAITPDRLNIWNYGAVRV